MTVLHTPDESRLGKGAIKSSKDKRDYKWEKLGFASIPFDWTKGFEVPKPLSIKDQGQSGSCGGQASSYYGEILNFKADSTQEEASAKFVYAPIAYPDGGSVGRDIMDRAVNTGWGSEKNTPSYENGKPPSELFMQKFGDITDKAIIEAKSNQALSYAKIEDIKNIDTIAQAIRDNDGAIIGLNGVNNGTWLSRFPQPPETYTWRHWIYATGAVMIGDKKYIKIINSWGTAVGENGYQYICEDYFKSGNCFEAWTLVYNKEKPQIGFKHRFDYDLAVGSSGDEVVALQKVLRLEGLFKYPIDSGNYGAVTQDAVYKYQKQNNLAPLTRWLYRGFYCGPATRVSLNKKYGN